MRLHERQRQVCEAQTSGLDQSENDPGACSQQANPANNCPPVFEFGCHFLSPTETQRLCPKPGLARAQTGYRESAKLLLDEPLHVQLSDLEGLTWKDTSAASLFSP